MQSIRIEPRPLYGIGTVARLTGVKPDTLRVWERRYGLGASHKSNTGRRQYTQSDLEHMQLVAALVKSGTRIGEIARAERKTLDLLVRSQGNMGVEDIPQGKAKALVCGVALCDWLEDHQGCLAHVDALFARAGLREAEAIVAERQLQADILVLECSSLAGSQLAQVKALKNALGAQHVMVTYQVCSERWQEQLKEENITAVAFPPESAYLAFELGRYATERVTHQGDPDLGQLVVAKPRQFDERQLSAASQLQSTLECECPRHITDLVRALAAFEAYSSSCSVENWHDAAVHACIYTYTGQARWLMEKALQAVLEERTGEFELALEAQTAEPERIGSVA